MNKRKKKTACIPQIQKLTIFIPYLENLLLSHLSLLMGINISDSKLLDFFIQRRLTQDLICMDTFPNCRTLFLIKALSLF